MILYFKAPDMPKGASVGGDFSSSHDLIDFLQYAKESLPDNTLLYWQGRPGEGNVWLLRLEQLYEVWSPSISRRLKMTMAEMKAAAPLIPTQTLEQEFRRR